MKKTVYSALLLLCAAQADAVGVPKIDAVLQKQGVVDSQFNVLDENRFMQAMLQINVAMKERIQREQQDNPNKTFVSVSPRGIYYRLTLAAQPDKELTPQEVEAYRQYNLYNMCHDGFGESQVFRKRNWTIRLEVLSPDNQQKFAQSIDLKDCPASRENALQQVSRYADFPLVNIQSLF